MGLRRLARQLKAGRRKAALAVGYAGYVEAARAAGQVVMSKRAWQGQGEALERGIFGARRGGRGAKTRRGESDDKNALSVEGCV